MSARTSSCAIADQALLPPSLPEWLPEDYAGIASVAKARPAHEPSMMVALLL